MPFYKVREGQTVGHNDGQNIRTLVAGDVVQLPRQIGERELAGKFEPCTEDGDSLAHLSADEYELFLAAPHERESLKAQFEARDAANAAAVAATEPEPEPQVQPAAPFVQVVEPAPASTPADEVEADDE